MISLTSDATTWMHRLPAGAKLAGLCAATALLFAQDTVAFHVAALAAVLALYLSGGPRFARAGLRPLRVLWPFVVLVGLWHLVTGDAPAGAVIVLRLVTAVALANLVTMTTGLGQMIAVIRWLTTPLRRLGVKTRAAELGIALVVRFTPALSEKGARLVEAWRARSPRRAGWRIVMPFTVLALDDAEHVADALRARGGMNP